MSKGPRAMQIAITLLGMAFSVLVLVLMIWTADFANAPVRTIAGLAAGAFMLAFWIHAWFTIRGRARDMDSADR